MTRALGPFVSAWSIKRAVRELLAGPHLGVYCDEIVRQQTTDGADVLRIERPRDVIIRERPGRLPENQLPCLVVSCSGGDSIRRDGEGRYTMRYPLVIDALTQSTNADIGGETANILALAAAALVLQALPTVDDRITDVSLRSEAVDDAPDGRRSRFGQGYVLELTIADAVSDVGLLPLDLTDPPIADQPADPGDLPTVGTTELNVTPVEEIPA